MSDEFEEWLQTSVVDGDTETDSVDKKPSSDDSILEDALLDEDSVLAGEDSGAEVDETSDNETSLIEEVDSATLLGPTSPTKDGVVLGSISPAGQLSPAKKRSGTALDSEDEESVAKKLKISREPVQPPPAKKAITPPSPTESTSVPAASESSVAGATAAGKVNIKAVSATLSFAERKKLRQEKFSLTDKPEPSAAGGGGGEAVSVDKLQQRAARFGISAPTPAGPTTKAAVDKGQAAKTPENQTALAKRRERFEKELADTKQNVDSTKEKRVQKLGSTLIGTAADTDDKKTTRAARFGS